VRFYFCLSVCLSVFYNISQKRMQLGSPNLMQKFYTLSPGNPFIKRSKVKVTIGHESQKQTASMGRCTLVTARLSWL